MRHLKKYNESIGWWCVDEIKTNYCDSYLAYLTDDGFTYDLTPGDDKITIIIKNPNRSEKSEFWPHHNEPIFYWDEIENTFVPFIEILKEQYDVSEIKIIKTAEHTTFETTYGRGDKIRTWTKNTMDSLLYHNKAKDYQITIIEVTIEDIKPKKDYIKNIKSFFTSKK